MRPTELAHQLLRDLIREGDTVIDATAGNGHDTLFLAEQVGTSGQVFAFDIQEAAITSTRQRLTKAGCEERVALHQVSHSRVSEHVPPASAAAIMFNLGYLPGEDHQLTTSTEETLAALEAATALIKPGGILSIVCYPGHEEGATEAQAVESWMTQLTADRWQVAKYAMLGTKKPAPYLLIATKGR